MTGGDVLVCFNPIAGSGRGAAVAEALRVLLPSATFEDRPVGQVAPAVFRERSAVVAVGGDGTQRAVVAALLRAVAEDGRLPPVGVVPLGTANLLAQHLGHTPPGLFRPQPARLLEHAARLEPLHPSAKELARWPARQHAERAVAALVRGRRRWIDVAVVAGGDLMLLMAGVGLDGDVIHAIQTGRSGPISKLDYLPVAAKAAWAFGFPALTIEVDGKPISLPTRGVAFCANVPEYGTGFPLLPNARSDDGLLDVCLLPCASKLELAKLFLLALGGRHHDAADVVRARGRSVRLSAEPAAPVQVDGEAAGHTPITLEITGRRVPFLLPG